MAFTVIVAGDPVLASVAMANWRHVNYGNALLPVDASGNGVNDTLPLGSTSYRYSNIYSVLGNFSGQLTSSVATGTAPFSPASTTLCPNLNADLLDSQEGTYYRNADNMNAGTLPTGRLAGAYDGITAVGATGLGIGDGLGDRNITFNGIASSGNGCRIKFQRSGTDFGIIGSKAAADGGNSNDFLVRATSSNQLHLGSNGVVGMTFDTSGDVGVITNFYVDTNVFYVKPSTNQVLIGKSSGLAQFEIEGASSSTLGTSVDALIEGGGSNNEYTQFGFGWSNGSTKPPVIIGSKTASASGNTKSDWFVAVRNVTTDTAPTEAFWVRASGLIEIVGDLTVGGDLYNIAWTDYSGTTTVSGFSSVGVTKVFYKKVGRIVFVTFEISGTSNSSAFNFTVPVASINSASSDFVGCLSVIQDNGSDVAQGACYIIPNASIVNIKRMSGLTFTSSGFKKAVGSIWYEAAS